MSDSEKNKKPRSDRQYETKTRKCLMCRNEFNSSWPGERICSNCKTETSYLPEVLRQAGIKGSEIDEYVFYRGEGCDSCGGSGYAGRQGLYEVLAMSPELRRMVLKGESSADIKEQAIAEGMITLRHDGLLKVKKGITTLDEVLKETAA